MTGVRLDLPREWPRTSHGYCTLHDATALSQTCHTFHEPVDQDRLWARLLLDEGYAGPMTVSGANR
jgi:hypothetical protein